MKRPLSCLLATIGLGLLGVNPASVGQSAPVIDAGSMGVEGTNMTFQFRALAGDTADFQILTVASLHLPIAWIPVPEASIDALPGNQFLVAVPLNGQDQIFFRIQRLGLPALGPNVTELSRAVHAVKKIKDFLK